MHTLGSRVSLPKGRFSKGMILRGWFNKQVLVRHTQHTSVAREALDIH